MDELRRQFGLQLRDSRKAARLKMKVVAERADITLKHLGDIELGKKSPSMELTLRLAEIIGVSASVFFEARLPDSPDLVRHEINRLLENRNTQQLWLVFRLAQAALTAGPLK